MKKYVSWRRVSTFKQGQSGLGLEAQKEIIKFFVERDKGKLLADYVEVYTGKDLAGCVELRKAMEHAKRENAILIIAKSDRFRNTAEALRIYEEMGNGNIMFCDLPATDKFTLTLFFALAEREALLVSIRTKQALAAKKARGCKLGAANEKYKLTMSKKTQKEIKEIMAKKGDTKNRRNKENRETQAFVRIMRQVFPDVCKSENPEKWKDWGRLNTRLQTRVTFGNIMRDYKKIDESGTLFAKWDLSDLESNEFQLKLSNKFNAIKKAFTRKP